jgi:phage-related protein
MPNTFSWVPSYSSDLSVQTRIRQVRFGDGYAQQSPDGLNNQPESYSLVFDKRSKTEAAQIAAFLRAEAAACRYFLFTPPTELSGRSPAVQKKFKCYDFRQLPEQFDSITITAKFDESFDP